MTVRPSQLYRPPVSVTVELRPAARPAERLVDDVCRCPACAAERGDPISSGVHRPPRPEDELVDAVAALEGRDG